MKKIKIGILGWFGYGNAGDEAMRDICLKEFPGSIASDRATIEKCDAYILAGGALVQGTTGVNFYELLTSTINEPCYAMSLGVKSDWRSQEEKAKKVLSRFRLIFARDSESAHELSSIVKVDGVMPDLVLLADAKKSKEKFPILFNYTDERTIDPRNQFKDIVKADNLLPIAVIPKDKGIYADKYVGYKEFISMAKSSQGVIGTRLHSVVMGVVAGVPVAGVAYSDKTRKFCERYEIPCFPYGKSCGKEIVRALKKPKIDLAQERVEIKKVIEKIKADLRKQFS